MARTTEGRKAVKELDLQWMEPLGWLAVSTKENERDRRVGETRPRLVLEMRHGKKGDVLGFVEMLGFCVMRVGSALARGDRDDFWVPPALCLLVYLRLLGQANRAGLLLHWDGKRLEDGGLLVGGVPVVGAGGDDGVFFEWVVAPVACEALPMFSQGGLQHTHASAFDSGAEDIVALSGFALRWPDDTQLAALVQCWGQRRRAPLVMSDLFTWTGTAWVSNGDVALGLSHGVGSGGDLDLGSGEGLAEVSNEEGSDGASDDGSDEEEGKRDQGVGLGEDRQRGGSGGWETIQVEGGAKRSRRSHSGGGSFGRWCSRMWRRLCACCPLWRARPGRRDYRRVRSSRKRKRR